MRKNWEYWRGDVYLANLDPVVGAEIGGIRPVLILQNNTGNFFSPTLIAAPLTSNIDKKPNQPTHFLLEQVRGLSRPSMVILEQLKTLDKRRIIRYMGRVDSNILYSPEFCKCLAVSLALSCIRDGQDLRFSNFVQVPLPLIPKDEQKKIAEYLNRKTARIDSIISDVTEQIEKLKEYRQSVISEVVTGKVAVI